MEIKKLYNQFSIIPLKGKIPILKNWTKYSTKKIEFEKIKNHQDNFGIVCGFEGLEVIDIDNHNLSADKAFLFINDNIDLHGFLVIKTKSGGYHLYYKTDTVEKNQALAQQKITSNIPIKKNGKDYIRLANGQEKRAKQDNEGVYYVIDTLIETRGQGGQVVFYNNILSGKIDKIKKLSSDEKTKLFEICKALNEVEKKTNIQKETKKAENNLPGDVYNNDLNSIQETKNLLRKNGWTSNDDLHWTRPGKSIDDGISATFGKIGKNKFYCWSSNAQPFQASTSYSMMGVRAELIHNGDYSSCAKELAQIYDIAPKEKEKEKPKKLTKWQALDEIIKDWKLKFRYNELTTIIDVSINSKKYKKLGLLTNNIVREMEVNRNIKSISVNKVNEMIGTGNICEIYNPINDFFSKLPKWDGIDYFKKLEKYIQFDVDEKPDFFFAMLKKHIIRAIKCAIVEKYINRMVFVLHGPQEIGKSMFFRWLSLGQLYYEEPINPADKDSILALARYLIINMDELDSLNKKDVAKLKAFISHGEVTKRVPYGRHDEIFPRIASFVGSTNKTDILADEKNTRWIILKILSFDWEGYTKNINPIQIWAQCKAELDKNTDAGELTIAEKLERDLRNDKEFLVISSEREILMKHFKEGIEPMTATDIKILIENKKYPLKLNFYQLLRELKRQFGEPTKPKKENGIIGRYYYLEHTLGNETYQPQYYNEPEQNKQVLGNDLPF